MCKNIKLKKVVSYHWALGLSFILFLNACDEKDNRIELLHKKIETQKGVINFLMGKKITEFENSNISLFDSITLTTLEDTEIKISEIKGDRSSLFFLFTSHSCGTCIDMGIDTLTAFLRKNISLNIPVYILTDQDPRTNSIYSSKLGKLVEGVYGMKGFENIFKKNIHEFPFFFILKKNSDKISDVYIHDKTIGHILSSYLENIVWYFE